MLTEAFSQIETWDGKKIKAVLAQAKGDAALQQALAERYMPILEHIGAKDLSALTTVANKLTTPKPLERSDGDLLAAAFRAGDTVGRHEPASRADARGRPSLSRWGRSPVPTAAPA